MGFMPIGVAGITKATKIHHSLEDWEFEAGHKYFIATDEFVSSPTSLCCPGTDTAAIYKYVFLKSAVAGNIPDGQIIVAKRPSFYKQHFDVYFRQQEPLAHLGDQNGYRVNMACPYKEARIYRYQDGVETWLATIEFTYYPSETWVWFTFQWYTFVSAGIVTQLRIRLLQWVDGEWQEQGYCDDIEPLFADSEVNRVGFALYGRYRDRPQWWDDTQIWKKAL